MKLVNLKEKEIKEANRIIEKYKELETALNYVQEKLEKLDKEREILISTLNNTRKNEDAFFTNLRTKYGEGKLDLYTMKYIVQKDENNSDI
jgi:predicted nuclease with TOPRIM domain